MRNGAGTGTAEEQAYFVQAAQRHTCTLKTLVRVAGRRECIKRGFAEAEQEAGLATHEVHLATGRYRHMTLALWTLMAAHHARRAPLAGLVKPYPDGPGLPLPKAQATDCLCNSKLGGRSLVLDSPVRADQLSPLGLADATICRNRRCQRRSLDSSG